jgi:hypothetical protein
METTTSRPLGRRLLAGGLASLLGVALLFVFAPLAKADPNLDEAQFFADLNAVRARNGVPPLATDGQLINVARAWSAQMAGAGGLSHNPNLGSQVSNWRTLGENVGTGSDVASIEAALEASPHHFANMVDPSYNYVGIGVVEANGAIWVTQDFKQAKTGALPSTATPAPAPKPAAPKPAAPRPAAPAPAKSAAPRTRSGAHSPAASPAASAGAGGPSAEATLASAPPAPTSSPPGASGSAKSHAGSLPKGLAVVSSSPVIDGPRFASLALFAVLGAAAILISHGHLPGFGDAEPAETKE